MDSVTQLLSNVVKEAKVSACKSRMELARKMNHRSKLIQKRKVQKQRIKKLTKELISTEAQVQLVELDIQRIEEIVNAGSDDEN